MRSTRRLLAVSVAVASLVAIPTTNAQAGSPTISINLGSGWVHDASTPLFDVSRIAPGFSQSETLLVRNDAGNPGDLALSDTDIVEHENGCMHSEAVIDATCGALQGELGQELQFNVYLDPENDGTFEAVPRWTGTLYDLTNPASLLTGIPAGGIAGLRVVMTLPSSSGNETQTDDVDFSFRLTLTGAGDPDSPGTISGSGSSTGSGSDSTPQDPGSVEVQGLKVTRHPHSGVLHDITSQLPFTGTPIERLVAGGLWLLIAGTALSLLATARRRRTAAEN